MSKFFQRLAKLHEPVGRVQFVVFKKIYKCLFIPNCTRKIMWLLINNTLEKIDNLKPLTIHLLLRYTGIAFNVLKLGKASKISGDLRRSPEIVGSIRVIFGNLREIFGRLRKYSDDLRKHSEMFGRSSGIFGRFRVVFGRLRTVFGNLRKVSHDLRRSSKYIGWPPAVFVLTSDIFVVICTRVSLFCTVLPFSALC